MLISDFKIHEANWVCIAFTTSLLMLIKMVLAEYKDAPFRVIKTFEPPAELRWNVAGVIRSGDKELLDLLNKHLSEMIEDGTISDMVEKYNVPYFKPFPEVASTYTATDAE